MTTEWGPVDSWSRRQVLGAVSALGTGAFAGCFGTGTDDQQGQDRSGNLGQQTSGSCELPVFTDEYVGFSVGRPEGWDIEYVGGIIWLAPSDPNDSTIAFVYPGWLQEGTSVEAVAQQFVAGLNDASGGEGDTVQWQPDNASLTGTIGGVSIEGELWPYQTDAFGVLAGGWTAEGMWTGLRDTVANVSACLDLFSGVPLIVDTVSVADQSGETTWEYAAPPDWQVWDSGSHAIDVLGAYNEGDGLYDAIVGFFGFPVISPAQSFTHQEYLNAIIQQFQSGSSSYEVLEVGSSELVGEFTDNLGLSWEMMAFPMVTTYGYKEMVTVVTTALARHEGYTFSQLWKRDVARDRWDELNAITSIVQGSIRIVSHQAGSAISPPMADSSVSDIIAEVGATNSAAQDRIGNQFSDAILSNDRVVIDDYPDREILVPSNNYDPAQCPEGQRPIPHPDTGEMVCGTRL